MEAASLIKLIADAFPVEPIPAKDDILYNGAYPEESELEEIKLFSGGRAWNSVTPGDVFRFRHALPCYSPRALTYYTAAWMTCSLLDEEAVDTGIEDLVSAFERVKVNLWTQAQRSIICQWLIHFQDTGSPSLKKRFEQAAENLGCDLSKGSVSK
jgi:hypothetical protein